MLPTALQAALLRRLRPIVVDSQFASTAVTAQHSSGRIPLTMLGQGSLDTFSRNEAPGTITVLREGSEDGRVLGVGFYDPSSVAVEVFEWANGQANSSSSLSSSMAEEEDVEDIIAAIGSGEASSSSSSQQQLLSSAAFTPSVPDVRFFHGKLMAAFRRRSTAAHASAAAEAAARSDGGLVEVSNVGIGVAFGNARRLFNGAADGIPSLYIDQYGSTAHVYVTSYAAGQLMPLVEILLSRVLEMRRVFFFTPETIRYGVKESNRAVMTTLDNAFCDGGITYYPPQEQLNPRMTTITDILRSTVRYAFHPLQHRQARAWLRAHCGGKNVVLMGDEASNTAAALEAVTAASKVYVSQEHERAARQFRRQFSANYNDTILHSRVAFLKSGALSFPMAKEAEASIVALSGVAINSRFVDEAVFACDFLAEGLRASRGGGRDGTSSGVGHLVLMCGSNGLGLPCLTPAGLIPSAEDIVSKAIAQISGAGDAQGQQEDSSDEQTLSSKKSKAKATKKNANSGGSNKPYTVVEVARFDRSEGFPHGKSLSAGGMLEGWGSAFCDVVLEVRLK